MVQHWPKMIELAMFCSMIFKKTLGKVCQAYIKDQHGCDKIYTTSCQGQIDGVSDFWKFWKNENSKKKSKFLIFEKRKRRHLGDQEALCESSARKLGWRFTARLPYWCKRNPRPRSTEFIYNMGLFEDVFDDRNHYDMKNVPLGKYFTCIEVSFWLSMSTWW